ncbi:transglycosylase SLT domain-containing protein [bacterium]|nr:transglycosylase SLT domain-containing protein [bacterium]
MRWGVALSAMCVVLSTCVNAQAGVYLFRDKEGRVVLSDVPANASAKRLIGDPTAEEGIGGFVADRERVALYIGLIRKFARTYNLPEHLVKAVIQVESAFNPKAVSHKGAVGLMQVMPATAQDIGILGDLTEPEVNIEAGCRYLAMMMSRFKGRVDLALAGYNAGPEAVVRAGGAIPDFPETKAYVNSVMDITSRFQTGSVYIVELSSGRFLLTNY